MSLLDFQDPALMSLGLRLLSTPGPMGQAFGKAGLGAMQDQNEIQARKQADDLRKLQMQQLQSALDQAQRQAQGERATQDYARTAFSPVTGINANQVSGITGPRPEALSVVGKAPGFDIGAALQKGVPISSAMQMQQMLQKDETPITVKENETLLNRKTLQPIFTSPPKAEPQPSAVKEYQFAKAQGYPGTFDQWDLSRKRAGASSVSVNTGEKGFKNELALKTDFKTEPIYKDYQDMQSAYKQIKAGIAAGTPIGDLATGTKIMKLLDPSSVVRESELGMAMAATGRMDRLQNFVQMQIKGEKLTPKQRTEFGQLAEDLYDAAGQAYNMKRSEYENIGNRYKIDTSGLGTPHRPVKGGGGQQIFDAADAILNGNR